MSMEQIIHVILIGFFYQFATVRLSHMVIDTPYCKVTNKSVDLDGECFDKNCAMYKNFLSVYSGVEDEFHRLYNSNNEKVVVYSNNGRIYYTECYNINAFNIIENVSVCTVDTLVKFQFHFIETDGYYTKNSIIRESSNYRKFCEFSSSIKNIGNINKEFSIFKYDKQVAIARRNDSLTDLDFEQQNQMVEMYDRQFGNSNIFIIIQALVVTIIFFLMFVKYLFDERKKMCKLVTILKISCKKISKKKLVLPTTNASQDHHIYPSAPYLPAPFPPQITARATVPLSIYDPSVYHTIGNHNYLTRSQSAMIIDNEKDLPFLCKEYTQNGEKCDRRFGTLQGLGQHIAKHIKFINKV